MVESKSRKRKKTSSEKEPSANNMKQERLKNSKSEEKKSLLMRAAGLLFAVGAGMCVAMSSVFVKKLSNDLSSLEIAVWRGIGNTILVFSYLVVMQDSGIFSGFNRNTFSLVLTRSVMFSIAIVLAFTVSQNLPLGDASALMSTSTIITGFLGIFILDEKWKLRDMLLSILCWCGVVLISRPSFLLNLLEDTPVVADDSRHRLTYIGFAIACATLTSMSHILVRKVGHRLDVAKITLFAEAVGFICSFLTLIWQEGEIRIPPENSWKYLLPICVASTCVQMLMNTSLRLEKASIASVLRTAGYVSTSFIFQIVIFNNIPSIMSVTGAVLILMSTVVIASLKVQQK